MHVLRSNGNIRSEHVQRSVVYAAGGIRTALAEDHHRLFWQLKKEAGVFTHVAEAAQAEREYGLVHATPPCGGALMPAYLLYRIRHYFFEGVAANFKWLDGRVKVLGRLLR